MNLPQNWCIKAFEVSEKKQGVKFYLIADIISKEAVVLNMGYVLKPILDEIDRSCWNVKYILVQSPKIEHAGRAAELSAKLKVPVIASKAHLPQLQHLSRAGDNVGLCGVKTPQIQIFLEDLEWVQLGKHKVKSVDLVSFAANG